MKNKSNFAQLIQNARIKKGITQFDLAVGIGISEIAVRKIEGDLYLPAYSTLQSLCRVLDLDLDNLVCNEDSLKYANAECHDIISALWKRFAIAFNYPENVQKGKKIDLVDVKNIELIPLSESKDGKIKSDFEKKYSVNLQDLLDIALRIKTEQIKQYNKEIISWVEKNG